MEKEIKNETSNNIKQRESAKEEIKRSIKSIIGNLTEEEKITRSIDMIENTIFNNAKLKIDKNYRELIRNICLKIKVCSIEN